MPTIEGSIARAAGSNLLATANAWALAQSMPVLDLGGQVFNVKAYGALGNGVADDTAALLAAKAAWLAAGGGTIYAPPGTYIFSRQGSATGDSVTNPYCLWFSATDPAGVIQGAGRGATIFKLAPDQLANTAILLARGASTGKRTAPLLVRDIELDGNGANQTVGSWDDMGMVTAVYADNVTLERCQLHDAKMFGFHALRDSQNFQALNCRVALGVASAQTQCFVEVARAAVLGCIFEGVKSTNLLALLSLGCNADIAMPGENMRILGNLFSGCGVQLAMSGIRHSVVANNLFIDQIGTSSLALKMEAWNHVTNKYDCLENLVTDNVFYNLRQGIQVNGLDATYGCKRNIVSGNQLIDGPDQNMTVGIQEAGTAAGNVGNRYRGNNIVGVSTTPFALNGTGSNARDNAGYKTEATGTATLLSANTSIVVTHGLASTPTRVLFAFTGDPGSATKAWVSAKGATTFTITTNAAPGADVSLDWRAMLGDE